MKVFSKTLLLLIFTLTLFGATMLIEQILQMYQDDTLHNNPQALASLETIAQENSDAAYLLATIYMEGKAGRVNLQKAYRWYLKAAKKGDGDAMLSLGWLYYKGELFGQSDQNKAKYWFAQAAQNGIDEANEMLDILGH